MCNIFLCDSGLDPLQEHMYQSIKPRSNWRSQKRQYYHKRCSNHPNLIFYHIYYTWQDFTWFMHKHSTTYGEICLAKNSKATEYGPPLQVEPFAKPKKCSRLKTICPIPQKRIIPSKPLATSTKIKLLSQLMPVLVSLPGQISSAGFIWK